MTPPPAPRHRPALPASDLARRHRRRRLLLPLAVLTLLLLIGLVGVVFGGGADRSGLAERYGAAFARGDYRAMHGMIGAADRRATPLEAFTTAHHDARTTATSGRITVGEPVRRGERVALPVNVATRLFGAIRGELVLAFDESGDELAVDWSPELVFAGLRKGEQLRSQTELPPRADLRAADGTTLVEGADRTPIADAALNSIVGQMGPIPEADRARFEAQGVPPDAFVGLTGLERIFEERLRGTPGGTLYAGQRELARTEPQEATAVRTSITPSVQRAAVAALDGRIGGIAVVRPSNGQIMALAGAAFSALQPPGSTFKIVTLAAALRYDAASPKSTYPVETETTLSGVTLQNADGEACGGSLAESFAHSCNSVFGPLGAKVGGEKLVATAEAFGFNAELGIPGAAVSSIPPASELGDDDLVLGSTGIGQGRVQATALQMALVAATIATRGERPQLTAAAGGDATRERVLPKQVASQVASMMGAVVSRGTGAAAKIDGVKVAGKTGTAELRTTQGECDPANPPPGGCPDPGDTTDTTAWFAGFAPAGTPRAAIAVQLVGHGQGGTTAAPVFRQVMTTALDSTR